jgi:heptosyltransferase III
VETGTLVVHPGALGDVLQAVPALRALRGRAPVTFVGQARLGRLLLALGEVERARAFEGFGLESLFVDGPIPAGLAETLHGAHGVVSWFGSRDATYVERLRAVVPRAIVAPPVPDDDAPVWRHLHTSVAGAAPPRVEPIRLPSPPAARPTLIVHPGSGGAWKLWPAERFAAVIAGLRDRRALDVLVHQGPADAEAAAGLLARLGPGAAALREPELPELAAALGSARGYLGGDSGVSHLAAAVGAPSVVLFPPATRRRWAPWSPTAVAIELTGPDEEVVEAARAALEQALATSR